MYLGLITGSQEPHPSTGYCRVEGDLHQTVGFPTSKGYGIITHVATYTDAVGGEPIELVELSAPVDCHTGVIPLWVAGKLLRGVDVSAAVALKSGARART